MALGVTITILAVASTLFLVSLPDVGDAEARVARVLRAHGAKDPHVIPSSRLARAVVAVEDQRFYRHHGIDAIGVGRSLVRSITGSSGDSGGSTITQQLARQLYGRGTLADLGLALKLEFRYSKPEILEMYLSVVYYGHGQWGADAASRAYFNKPPRQLDWAEASLLAGLLQAPSAYDPVEHFRRARARQREVLNQLVVTHVLTQRAADDAYQELDSLRH